jgi:hypothetical protein
LHQHQKYVRYATDGGRHMIPAQEPLNLASDPKLPFNLRDCALRASR